MRIAIFEHAVTRVKGGMEKITIDIASHMCSKGNEILILTDNDKADAKLVFDHNAKIEVINLDLINIDITSTFLTILQDFKADIFLFVYASNHYLAPLIDVFKRSRIPIIFSEHNNPDYLYITQDMLQFRNAVLSMGAVIHLLLDDYKDSLPSHLHSRVLTIGNPVTPPQKISNSTRSSKKKKVLYVGRISNNPKQINILIEAFSKLTANYPDWSLDIWGHGPDVPEILTQIQEYSLEHCVFYRGKSDAIEEEYQSGHILCLPSLYEGFPLVVGEAFSHGLPVVGFSCCSGVNSLVNHEKNGLLVEEITASSLAEALEKLMQNDSYRKQLGQAARNSISTLSPDYIFNKWEELLYKAQETPKSDTDKSIESEELSLIVFDAIRQSIPFYSYHGGLEELVEYEKLQQSLSAQIAAIHNSQSWKITEPLRRIITTLRELRRK